MPAIADLRAQLAAAHLFISQLEGKTLDLHAQGSATSLPGFSGLYCIARECNHREDEALGLRGIEADRVFEVARQGPFTGENLAPHRNQVKYEGVFWEIMHIQTDDAEIGTVGGRGDASVYLLYARRLQTEIGRLPA